MATATEAIKTWNAISSEPCRYVASPLAGIWIRTRARCARKNLTTGSVLRVIDADTISQYGIQPERRRSGQCESVASAASSFSNSRGLQKGNGDLFTRCKDSFTDDPNEVYAGLHSAGSLQRATFLNKPMMGASTPVFGFLQFLTRLSFKVVPAI